MMKDGERVERPLSLNLAIKRGITINGKPISVEDSIAAIIYDRNVGIILVFFLGSFRILRARDYEIVWQHSEMNMER